jgi:NTP pyrophosphatase (non-canonical NTP hydrolase)
MAIAVSDTAVSRPRVATLDVVVSGSFRRGLDALRQDRDALVDADCRILSPIDVDFVADSDGFVVAAHEQNVRPSEIEDAHIAAIRASDFVWFHLPEGYLGPSGAFELGVAASAGVPVFARTLPRDVGLRHLVHVVASPAAAANLTRHDDVGDPGANIRGLQKYYERVAGRRGWSSETPIETIVLLTEELGELARAVRQHVGLSRSRAAAVDPGEELADMQLYLVHLANSLGIDLATAVTEKEVVNGRRALSA